MKRSEVNTCPERARKRATSDLRCAAKKLGAQESIRLLVELFGGVIVHAACHAETVGEDE